MNKFFKRILPATILATCCTVSVFSMTACNEGKDYSDDFAKLQQQIDDQKNQINDLKNENSSLKDQISNITPGGTDYTEEIEKLQQQIETLKGQNGSNLAEISKLEQQLENLKTNNESNLAEIDKLQQQINNQKLLIESLQNAVNVEPKIYKVGETFTYSYQGVEFFSLKITIDEYDWWQLTVQNFRMGNRKASEYIGCLFMSNAGSVSNGAITDTSITPNDEYTFAISAKTDFHIKLLLGFPLQNNNLVPYAIYDLTSSV